jgi:virginiamycin B lyase
MLMGVSRVVRLMALMFVAAIAGCGWSATAKAAPPGFIFWSNLQTGRIGRASIDGTGVNQGFITGASQPGGVALDSQYVYWANTGSGTIGRATIKGTGVNQTFIRAGHPMSVAVDAQHIYWTDTSGGTIGRANVDGTGINRNFITVTDNPVGVAVNSKNIYWTTMNSIGRANLDGTGVNQAFIHPLPAPDGIALDSAHIYWSSVPSSNLGRANLDGTGVILDFIPAALTPLPVAVSGGRIYWGSLKTNTVGEAKIDGTSPDNSFITGADTDGPSGLAVTGAAVPRAAADPTALAFGSHPLNTYGTPMTVTITDTGSAPVHITGVQLGGRNAGDFLTAADNCSGNLINPGHSCTIKVLFGPQASGSRAATLSVTSDDPLSPLVIGLSGAGSRSLVGAPKSARTITCKTSTRTAIRKVHGRRRRVRVRSARCSGMAVAAMGRFSVARATVSRGAAVFATGTGTRTRKGALRLTLAVRRTLRSGGYALSLRYRQRHRWVTRGVPVKLVV